MSGTLTNGFDIVVMLSEAELTRSVRASGQFRLNGALPGVTLGEPTMTLDAPPGQVERVTATLPFTMPYNATTVSGTLAVGERLTVRPVAGRPTSREVVLDFARAGAPDLLEVAFDPASLAVLGSDAAALVPAIEKQVRIRLLQLKAVAVTPPGGIPISATATAPLTVTDLQARVIDDPGGADADALAFLMRTCGPDPSGPAPSAGAFSTSLVPPGGAAAVVVSNWPVLRCGVRAALLTAGTLGLTAADFAAVPPCALAGPKGITAGGHSAVLTGFTASVPPGVNGIVVTGGVAKTTAAYTATAAFTATVTFTVVTAADGSQSIVPVVSTPVVTASISLAWWVYAGIGLGAAYFGGVAAAVVALIVTAVIDAVVDAVLTALVAGGIGGVLRGLTAGLTFPLGPAAAGLMIDTLVLDDLMILGEPVLRDVAPMLAAVDRTGAPAATAAALGTPVVGTAAPLPVFLDNLGSTAVTVEELLLDDPDRAFTAGVGLSLPWRIPAGARSAALGCEFRPPGEGPFTATLALLTDDPGGRVVRVELTGTGAPIGPHGRLAVRPATIDFGPCLLGTTTALPVTVENVGDADAYFSVTVAGPGPATDFHGPWVLPSPVPAGETRTFNLLYAPTATGPARAAATLDVSGNSTYTEQHSVTLAGQAGAPVLVLDPPTLDFGVLPPGAHVSRPLTIHNAGDLDLVVRGFPYATGAPSFYIDPTVVFPLTVPPGGQVQVPFTTTSAPQPGQELRNGFDVDSNDPGAQRPRPRFSTVVRTAGPRIVTTDDVDFGRLPAGGGPVTATISLGNTGSSDLTVAAVRLSQGTSFRLPAAPAPPWTIPAGAQHLVPVEFTAARAGQYIDRVTVDCDDAARPHVSIGVTAVRTAPAQPAEETP